METSSISTPVTSTVHWLAATLSDAINLAILVRTSLSIQVSLGGDLKGPAALILMLACNMVTAAVHSPVAFAVHRLATTALGAVLEIVSMWASIAIIQGNLAHTVHTATLILVANTFVVAGVIVAPRSNTVHRLSTFLIGALLESVCVWASVSVVGSSHFNLVQSASLILMSILVICTRIILIPSTKAVNWLRATN